MPKFVNKDVIRKCVVRSDSAVEIEDAAATVSTAGNDHFDERVRCKLRLPPQRAIVERQHVSFRSERVVSRAQRRIAIDAGRRSRDPRLRRRWTKRPHVEAAPVLFEGRRREEHFSKTTRISL